MDKKFTNHYILDFQITKITHDEQGLCIGKEYLAQRCCPIELNQVEQSIEFLTNTLKVQ